jgi:hypothetical protein
MTIFPTLRAASWEIQLGSFPASVGRTMNGKTSIVTHSGLETARTWPATFTNITYDEFKLILAHWEEHGTVYSFAFDNYTLPTSETPTGYRWRYTAKPEVVDSYNNIITVSCGFEARYFAGTMLPPVFARVGVRSTTAAYSPAAATPSAPAVSFLGLSAGVTVDGFVQVTGLQPGASWEYSSNSGSSWTTGQGSGFRLPPATYSAGQVRVRQSSPGGTSAAAQNASAVIVAPQGSAVISIPALAGGATATGTVTLPAQGLLVAANITQQGWFSLYASAAAAAADVGRSALTEPARGVGVIADPRVATGQLLNFTQFETFRNEESPQSTAYPWRFKNEGGTADVLIVLTYLPL